MNENKDEAINIGDICTYFYGRGNNSLSIVEVVKHLSDKVAVVKFRQVIKDDSGNGLFTYLHKTGKTMNVSKEYLTKIASLSVLKAELDVCKELLVSKTKYCEDEIRFFAVKDFVEKLKMYYSKEDAILPLRHICIDEKSLDDMVESILESNIYSRINKGKAESDNLDYEECKYYVAEETDYDRTNGHSSYESYCTLNEKKPLFLPDIQCRRCEKKEVKDE